jgi:hypothetical protein
MAFNRRTLPPCLGPTARESFILGIRVDILLNLQIVQHIEIGI